MTAMTMWKISMGANVFAAMIFFFRLVSDPDWAFAFCGYGTLMARRPGSGAWGWA